MTKSQLNNQGIAALGIFVTVLVLGAVGLIGWRVYGAHRSANLNESKVTTAATVPEVKKQTKPMDQYERWKTARLTDEKLGFRYPSDWTLSGSGDNDGNSDGSAKTENIEVKSPVSDGRYFSVSLMAGPGNTTINLNMWLFAVDRGALPGQWVHAARRAALVSRIRAW